MVTKSIEHSTNVAIDDDLALVEAIIHLKSPILVEELEDTFEANIRDNATSFKIENLQREIVDIVSDKHLKRKIIEKVTEGDIDMLYIDETIMAIPAVEELIGTKAVDLPHPQGIQAVVDNTDTFSGKLILESNNKLVA